jgi:uncharacterized protein
MKIRCIDIKFLFLLLGLSNISFAQVNKYRNVLPDGNMKIVYNQAKNNKNEVQFAFSTLFLAYKSFFSSQDLTVCTFTPSCSEFGILSVKKYGVVKGGIMTMDRLTRCNGLSPQNYEVDKKTLLLKDDPGHIHKVALLPTEN